MENKSVLITVFLLIAVIVIGFAFYQYFTNSEKIETEEQETTDPTEITYPTITPQEVVEAFLLWYISDENAIPSNAYLNAEALTTDFKDVITNLLQTPDAILYDPFVCTETLPVSEEIAARPAQINGTTANVVVETTTESTENSFIYELTLTDGAWKISNVLCFIKG